MKREEEGEASDGGWGKRKREMETKIEEGKEGGDRGRGKQI